MSRGVKNPERDAEIIRLREQGLTHRRVGEVLGCTHSVVAGVCARHYRPEETRAGKRRSGYINHEKLADVPLWEPDYVVATLASDEEMAGIYRGRTYRE
jgi:hypothetical protein